METYEHRQVKGQGRLAPVAYPLVHPCGSEVKINQPIGCQSFAIPLQIASDIA